MLIHLPPLLHVGIAAGLSCNWLYIIKIIPMDFSRCIFIGTACSVLVSERCVFATTAGYVNLFSATMLYWFIDCVRFRFNKNVKCETNVKKCDPTRRSLTPPGHALMASAPYLIALTTPSSLALERSKEEVGFRPLKVKGRPIDKGNVNTRWNVLEVGENLGQERII